MWNDWFRLGVRTRADARPSQPLRMATDRSVGGLTRAFCAPCCRRCVLHDRQRVSSRPRMSDCDKTALASSRFGKHVKSCGGTWASRCRSPAQGRSQRSPCVPYGQRIHLQIVEGELEAHPSCPHHWFSTHLPPATHRLQQMQQSPQSKPLSTPAEGGGSCSSSLGKPAAIDSSSAAASASSSATDADGIGFGMACNMVDQGQNRYP